jgi:hypothetical protein
MHAGLVSPCSLMGAWNARRALWVSHRERMHGEMTPWGHQGRGGWAMRAWFVRPARDLHTKSHEGHVCTGLAEPGGGAGGDGVAPTSGDAGKLHFSSSSRS